MKVIDDFDGEYRWLSNFWMCDVEFEGIMYPSSEHAYQAAKTLDVSERLKIQGLSTPGKAKREGQKVTIRPDWDKMKDGIMEQVCLDKFTRHPELKQKLIDTGDAMLIEGNTWGDRYWGTVNGIGQNKLGMVLMYVREQINL